MTGQLRMTWPRAVGVSAWRYAGVPITGQPPFSEPHWSYQSPTLSIVAPELAALSSTVPAALAAGAAAVLVGPLSAIPKDGAASAPPVLTAAVAAAPVLNADVGT